MVSAIWEYIQDNSLEVSPTGFMQACIRTSRGSFSVIPSVENNIARNPKVEIPANFDINMKILKYSELWAALKLSKNNSEFKFIEDSLRTKLSKNRQIINPKENEIEPLDLIPYFVSVGLYLEGPENEEKTVNLAKKIFHLYENFESRKFFKINFSKKTVTLTIPRSELRNLYLIEMQELPGDEEFLSIVMLDSRIDTDTTGCPFGRTIVEICKYFSSN